jgi:hypothetical protein
LVLILLGVALTPRLALVGAVLFSGRFIGLIGQRWLLWRRRHAVASLLAALPSRRLEFTIAPDGLVAARGGSRSLTGWDAIARSDVMGGFVLIVGRYTKRPIAAIPEAAFSGEDAVGRFVSAINDRAASAHIEPKSTDGSALTAE